MYTRGTAAQEGPPPPAVVFHRELEVRQRNGDERRHYDQDDEHQRQDAVDGVHLRRQQEQLKVRTAANV